MATFRLSLDAEKGRRRCPYKVVHSRDRLCAMRFEVSCISPMRRLVTEAVPSSVLLGVPEAPFVNIGNTRIGKRLAQCRFRESSPSADRVQADVDEDLYVVIP